MQFLVALTPSYIKVACVRFDEDRLLLESSPSLDILLRLKLWLELFERLLAFEASVGV
jgi:hypothetical protein